MKKRIMSIATILLMAVGMANAQIFVFENEEDSRTVIEPSETPFIPDLGETNDQGYVPIGIGILVLAGFAGAYLFVKKRKNKET